MSGKFKLRLRPGPGQAVSDSDSASKNSRLVTLRASRCQSICNACHNHLLCWQQPVTSPFIVSLRVFGRWARNSTIKICYVQSVHRQLSSCEDMVAVTIVLRCGQQRGKHMKPMQKVNIRNGTSIPISNLN